MRLPRLVRLRQIFERPRVDDVGEAVRRELARAGVASHVGRGDQVAVAVGSRGIANLPQIVAATVRGLRAAGGEPFVVPAMGSHGGATAGGQARTLAHLGVSSASVGVPVRSAVETVVVGETEDGVPVHLDQAAVEADGLVAVNRVKPHTVLGGLLQSGIAKMLLIGLGNPHGARCYHRAFADHGVDRVVHTALPLVLRRVRLLCGLALVENAYQETARVAAVRPQALLERERELLDEARRLMPRLPFGRCHLLVMDWLGKDVSGSGLDTNVAGRGRPGPECRRIFARDLTPASEGNGIGVGLVEFTTRRLVDRIDPRATFANCSTSLSLRSGAVPFAFESDREAVEAALDTIGLTPPHEARVIWIRDTATLGEVEVSEALSQQAAERQDLEVLGEPHDWPFDDRGNLLSPFPPRC
ncbi:MAG: lactate racemase domain-containing protein [Candidatus Brocadiia bacterium]